MVKKEEEEEKSECYKQAAQKKVKELIPVSVLILADVKHCLYKPS